MSMCYLFIHLHIASIKKKMIYKTMTFLVKFVTAINLVVVHVTGDCPSGFVAKGSSCYHFSSDAEPWVNARNLCSFIFTAKLAEINSATEDADIKAVVAEHDRDQMYWLGSTDVQTVGVWRYASSNQAMTYQGWAPGEPNNYGQSEDCLGVATAGWFDLACDSAHRYICEKPLNPT